MSCSESTEKRHSRAVDSCLHLYVVIKQLNDLWRPIVRIVVAWSVNLGHWPLHVPLVYVTQCGSIVTRVQNRPLHCNTLSLWLTGSFLFSALPQHLKFGDFLAPGSASIKVSKNTICGFCTTTVNEMPTRNLADFNEHSMRWHVYRSPCKNCHVETKAIIHIILLSTYGASHFLPRTPV